MGLTLYPEPLYFRPPTKTANQSPTCQLIPPTLIKSSLHITKIGLSGSMSCSPKIAKNIVHILPWPLLSPYQYTVPAIRIRIQFFKTPDNASPDRVEMNIPDKLLKIHIFLAHNGFIAILK
jgi:hypothetical protein